MAIELTSFSKYKVSVAANLPDYIFTKPLISNRNRLEGLPRTDEFDRSLRAEIADPLWMLCRQWQFGEFQGEDAATAFQAKILAEHQQPEIIHFNEGTPAPFNAAQNPLEPIVESETLKPDYYLCLQMGRQFLKLLDAAGLSVFKDAFTGNYPIAESINANDKEAIYLSQCTGGAFPNGFKIMEEINNGSFGTFVKTLPSVTDADIDTINKDISGQFIQWYTHLYHLPSTGQPAWRPDRMEYNFAMELPLIEGRQKTRLEANEYASGKIDWLSFDENTTIATPGNTTQDNFAEVVQSFIPTPLQYAGMPHPRFWQMEDSRVDFGKIQTGTSGLLSILLAEYGLTYSNDWFVLPYLLKTNTFCEVKEIMVTDIFGQNILIEPTFKDPEMNWHEFACFRHTEIQNNTLSRNRFYLAPSALKLQQSEPLEKINFMRDEMTNMVWAIESIVPSGAGGSRQIKSSLTRYDQNFVPADPEAKIRYLLGTSVPENWIPFIPVHKETSEQEIRLQRARIPNAPLPTGSILTEQQPVHFIEEEEVPRAGVIVTRTYKRTRWLNGKTYLWIGRTKTTGKGEGWSGLMFDQILSVQGNEV
ncbi:MAG: hypothetical protein QM640_10215 [Niabella sp.]